jgi:hypothetical protein
MCPAYLDPETLTGAEMRWPMFAVLAVVGCRHPVSPGSLFDLAVGDSAVVTIHKIVPGGRRYVTTHAYVRLATGFERRLGGGFVDGRKCHCPPDTLPDSLVVILDADLQAVKERTSLCLAGPPADVDVRFFHRKRLAAQGTYPAVCIRYGSRLM